MKKFSVLTLTCALFLSAAVNAAPYYTAQYGYSPFSMQMPFGQYGGYNQAPRQAVVQQIDTRNMNPQEMLTVGVNAVQAFMSSKDVSNKERALAFLKEQVSGYFDFKYMSKWVAGRSWKNMDAGQRQELSDSIKNKFLNTLAMGIGGYSESRVEVLPARQGSKSEVIVPISVTNRAGNSVRMEFRFYRSQTGWKIFDVKANGQSAVIYYRRHFQKMLRHMNQPMGTWR